MTINSFKSLAKFIEDELGIVYSEQNFYQLQGRIEEISNIIGVQDLKKLGEMFRSGGLVQYEQLLLDLSTNNETSFFRDQRIFDRLEQIFTDAIKSSTSLPKPLRIWSAACSSGQEPVSLAILLFELGKKLNVKIDFSIISSDISESILLKAKQGSYSNLEVSRGLSEYYLLKYFKRNDLGKWELNQEIRDHLFYQKINLINDYPFEDQFHLILCRNVLIYQNIASKKEILRKITNKLIPGGYLVLGSGESLIGLSTDYEQMALDNAIIYRKKVSS